MSNNTQPSTVGLFKVILFSVLYTLILFSGVLRLTYSKIQEIHLLLIHKDKYFPEAIHL